MSKERERLIKAFFEHRTARGKLCNYPDHGYHYRDFVEGGRWYYHDHLIASLQVLPGSAPQLWISHAGYPTVSTFSRLRSVIYAWLERVNLTQTVSVDLRSYQRYWDTVLLEVFNQRSLQHTWYHFPEDGLLLSAFEEGLTVRNADGTPAEEVLPPDTPADVTVSGVGRFVVKERRVFFSRWGGRREGLPFREVRSVEHLLQMLALSPSTRVFSKRKKFFELLLSVKDVEELIVVLFFIRGGV